jgi:hypothetical protein
MEIFINLAELIGDTHEITFSINFDQRLKKLKFLFPQTFIIPRQPGNFLNESLLKLIEKHILQSSPDDRSKTGYSKQILLYLNLYDDNLLELELIIS